MVRLEKARNARVEAHHSVTATILAKRLLQSRHPAPDVAVDLDLEKQWDLSVHQLEQAFQRWDRPIADPKPAQLGMGRLGDKQMARAHPPGLAVVENEDPVVGR